jgi:hypothetical protein
MGSSALRSAGMLGRRAASGARQAAIRSARSSGSGRSSSARGGHGRELGVVALVEALAGGQIVGGAAPLVGLVGARLVRVVGVRVVERGLPRRRLTPVHEPTLKTP